LEQALEAAKAQISDLQNQLQASQPPSGNNSFLDANSWGNAGRTTEKSVTGSELPANMPKQNVTPLPHAARAASPGFLSGGGGMLGTIAATAAGVAGGAFLFQGIGHLLGNQQRPDASEKPVGKEADASTQNQDAASNDAQVDDNSLSGDLFADDGSSNDGSYEV
jgi:hypothetical protein